MAAEIEQNNEPRKKGIIKGLLKPVPLFVSLSEDTVDLDNTLNLRIRVLRCFGNIGTPAALLLYATFAKPRPSLGFVFGVALWTMYICYFLVVWTLVFSATKWCHIEGEQKRSLYRIYSRTAVLKDWARMSIAVYQELHAFEPIESISEMSAIDGGILLRLLDRLGAFTLSGVFAVYAGQLYFNDDFVWKWYDLFTCVGTVGLLILSDFELDPYNPWLKRIHSFGASVGVCSIIGFVWQQYFHQNYVGFSYALTICGSISLICWQAHSWFTRRVRKIFGLQPSVEIDANADDQIDDAFKDEITKTSILSVIFESVFLFCGATSICFFLMDYENH